MNLELTQLSAVTRDTDFGPLINNIILISDDDNRETINFIEVESSIPDSGIVIDTSENNIALSGSYIDTYDDSGKYVSRGSSDISEEPTAFTAIRDLPPSKDLFLFEQDETRSKTVTYTVNVNYDYRDFRPGVIGVPFTETTYLYESDFSQRDENGRRIDDWHVGQGQLVVRDAGPDYLNDRDASDAAVVDWAYIATLPSDNWLRMQPTKNLGRFQWSWINKNYSRMPMEGTIDTGEDLENRIASVQKSIHISMDVFVPDNFHGIGEPLLIETRNLSAIMEKGTAWYSEQNLQPGLQTLTWVFDDIYPYAATKNGWRFGALEAVLVTENEMNTYTLYMKNMQVAYVTITTPNYIDERDKTFTGTFTHQVSNSNTLGYDLLRTYYS